MILENTQESTKQHNSIFPSIQQLHNLCRSLEQSQHIKVEKEEELQLQEIKILKDSKPLEHFSVTIQIVFKNQMEEIANTWQAYTS